MLKHLFSPPSTTLNYVGVYFAATVVFFVKPFVSEIHSHNHRPRNVSAAYLQVVCESTQNRRIVTRKAKSGIARPTKPATELVCFVIVVQMRSALTLVTARSEIKFRPTYFATIGRLSCLLLALSIPVIYSRFHARFLIGAVTFLVLGVNFFAVSVSVLGRVLQQPVLIG